MSGPVLLVGCGKMGGAMLGGWLDRGLAADSVHIVEPFADNAAAAAKLGVNVYNAPGDLPADLAPAVVIFAVKPQQMADAAPAFSGFTASAVYLSIAAGTPISTFENFLGSDAAIVRSMPNTPAAVRRGITVACPNDNVSDEQRALCHDMLEAVGDVGWVDDEGLIDAVTATSGSGPAYVFLLIECLAKAGQEAGLSAEMAMQLAAATVSGAGELARQADDEAAVLRKNVTSPGGTTAAALEVLMAESEGLQQLMTRAVAAAADRSRELAKLA
ncbi:MAG: pyrroline-5-carboxylate reductase [Alphaproteobacteria bacterium]|nr:pyrroline-5-carboxylate reductase [Alphaproteobacteria bacterium]